MSNMLRIKIVSERTGYAQGTLRNKVRAGQFPKPIRLSSRFLVWPEDIIDEWLKLKERETCAQ